jgi:hypothetical protein
MNTLDVLDRLEQVTGGVGKWMACCPAHNDKSPSLAVSEGDDRVLVHCFAGCETTDVTAAIGLNVADLFYKKLADSDLTERKRRRYEEVLRSELIQVAVIDSAEKNERVLTSKEKNRRHLGHQRISKIEGVLNE